MTWAWAKQTKAPLARTDRGFTIVELLIVIVIIAILATIAIVAYNGIQNRAKFSRQQDDLAAIVKALELYKTINNAYPITDDLPGCVYDWCGWNQATGDDFIPGLAPEFIKTTPQMPSSLGNGDTYIYQGRNGTDYQLLRFKNDPSLPAYETTNNPLLALTNGYYVDNQGAIPDTYYAWGYRTNTNGEWW